ncbi:unnamed protein product [Callosobruchus maculatus]|uniref:THAP-type domain-containing protein n=1 Tax=Callosobruchus maculatus TaxID=64391 RepID=A0A653DJ82_CALMS|nr:unnamed protein product [Callosobruchus maculatus]
MDPAGQIGKVTQTRCSYFMCGKSIRNTPGLRTFTFPVNDENRCMTWMINSGNADLLKLDPKKLKKLFICQDHFEKKDIGTRLVPTAVPIKYHFKEGDPVTYKAVDWNYPIPSTSKAGDIYFASPSGSGCTEKVEDSGDRSVLQDIINLPGSDSPERQKLKRKVQELERDLTSTKTVLKRLKVSTQPRRIQTLPPLPRSLVTMQLFHKKKTSFSVEEKHTSLSLYYKSPSTYKFLRANQVVLPSPSTLFRWLKILNYSPGCNRNLFRCLKLKVDTMSRKSRQCILMFDEMTIKQALEYSSAKGKVEGCEDLGKLGRSNRPAKQALVFLVRGLYASWKMPVSFYFGHSTVKAADLLHLLDENLTSLKNTGLNVVAVVCDQGTNNQKLFKLLNVTPDTPYFMLREQKYFALYDVPHLMKNVRNNFINGAFLFDEDKVASFQDVEVTYQIDTSSKTGRALPKLTDTHLHPGPFQKMNVRLAVQLLSHSVSAAIKTAHETGDLKSDTAMDTAYFLEIVDKAFDALNSRNVYTKNPYRCALSENTKKPFKALKEAKSLFTNIVKIMSSGDVKRVPCFDGFVQTINSVEMMYQEQLKQGYKYLLTARLNQDVLENQFSIYRQKGGYSRNPTVRTFQAAFKSNCAMNLMKPSASGNSESCTDESLLQDMLTVDQIRYTEESSDGSDSDSIIDMAQGHAFVLEDCAIMYFAGYLTKKNIQKFSCSQCKNYLSSDVALTETNDILLFYKNYNIDDPCSLTKPTDLMFTVTKLSMQLFAHKFPKLWHKKGISKILVKKITNKIKSGANDWFQCPSQCVPHRQHIIELLVKILIYKNCKDMSNNIKCKIQKKSQKLDVVNSI